MPSTPLTCCSIGRATASITVRALAPGSRVVTCTVGGTTSGYCATGRRNSATAPTTMNRTASTFASTGRAMKKSEIMARPLFGGFGRRGGGRPHLRVDLLARAGALDAGDDHAVVGLEPFLDRAQLAEPGTDGDLALLEHIVLADHQHIAPALVGAERGVGNEQGILRILGHAHANEISRQQHLARILQNA